MDVVACTSASMRFESLVSKSSLLTFNNFFRNRFSIINPSNGGKEVDDISCQIKHHWHFTGFVILREGVMIIVGAFTKSCDGSPYRFDGGNGGIIRLVSKGVSSRVDEPCGMKSPAITEEGSGVECNQGTFTPSIYSESCGEEEAHDQHQSQVIFALESKNGILFKIREVEFFCPSL